MLDVMGQPILSYLLERMRACKSISRIIVATTVEPVDDALAAYCTEQGIEVFRGSETDVLDRIYRSVEAIPDEYFIKFWGDSPIIDVGLCDEIVSTLDGRFSDFDYVSNNHPSTYPEGMQIEVIKLDALKRSAQSEAITDFDREHVTTAIWRNSENYRIGNIENEHNIHDEFRLVVDYPEDFEQIRAILTALYSDNPLFTLPDIVEFLENNPQVRQINTMHIESESDYYDRIAESNGPGSE
jgi:spore coat polysaccharide biosynthesis protein SpsF (cytidylyltransferase family)